MKPKVRDVGEYIRELESTIEGRPEQVKQGLEIYIDLWKKAVENGAISMTDDVETALQKIEGKGGLYRAAEV